MDKVNCLFKRKPASNDKHCNLTADCNRCVWNLNSGEAERRKRQIRNAGLARCEDGLWRLAIRR